MNKYLCIKYTFIKYPTFIYLLSDESYTKCEQFNS